MERLLGHELFGKINYSINIDDVMEIRLRVGQDVYIKTYKENIFIDHYVDETLLNYIIDVATNNSRYAYERELNEGYIGYKYGVRIGLCGESVITDGAVITKQIYSLCIRIPHEVMGCSCKLGFIIDNFDNTLIISPPGCGKTTLLRDMARRLAEIYDTFIIDEREEICGKGLVLKHGSKSDVIQGIPKGLVYERAIRTMSPQIIICDELFGQKDEEAVVKIISSGVKILATYHSDDINVPFGENLFINRILLSSDPTPGNIKSIKVQGK